MHYMGSKARHAADIIAITCAARRPDQIYVEPFVGGGNVINKVPQGAGRIANDKNYAMATLLDQLGNHGWTPPETMTEREWRRIMKQDVQVLSPSGQALYALCNVGVTFGSMWGGQWIKDPDRWRQAREGALRDAPGLKGIEFHSGSYNELVIPPGSLVYCDPPYVNTTEYSGSKITIKVGDSHGSNNWKASKFWQWCDTLIDTLGCSVYVSEYTGPAPSVYPSPASVEQKERLAAARAAFRSIQSDEHSTSQQIEEAKWPIRAIEEEIDADAVALAARWKAVWQKEVISDFSASRTEGASGKTETECLFHRE